MNFKKWLNVTIRDKVLTVLEGLADQLKDNQGKPDWRKAIELFDNFCDNNLELPPDQQALVNKVITTLKLSNEVAKIQAFWQKVPQPIRESTQSLETLSSPITWNLLGTDGEGLNWGNISGPEDKAISFSGNAGLALTLQTANTIGTMAFNCQPGEQLMEIGMAGRLQVNPQGNVHFGFVGLSGGVNATGNLTLAYYFLDKAQWLLAEALVHNIPHLASPLDCDDIVSEKTNRLEALSLNVEGTLTTSMNLSAGKTWGTTFNLKDDDLDIDNTVSIGAAVSAKLDSSLNLEGSWNVLVSPTDDNTLTIKIRKAGSVSKNYGITLNASVGLNGLEPVAVALLNRYMPEATTLLTELQQFSNFGTLLKNDLKTRLEQLMKIDNTDGFWQQLANVVTGDESTGTLVNTIADAAEASLNNHLNLLENNANDSGDELVKDLVAHFKLPLNLSNQLQAKADTEITTVLDGIKAKLGNRLQEIITNNTGHLETLFKPLGAIGKDVSNMCSDVNKLSNQLLEPIIEFLIKYQQQRNKILSILQASANLKLSLYFSRVLSSNAENNTVLELEVETNNPKARQYYKEIMTGNVSNALKAARTGTEGSEGIKLTGGSFKNSLTESISTNLQFNILGIKINAETLLNSKVQIQLDATGDIIMADSTSTIEKTFSAFGKSWDIKFINMFEIQGIGTNANALPGTSETCILSSCLSLAYQDTHLKENELDTYLESLERVGLMSPDILSAVNNRYIEVLKTAQSKDVKMGGQINLSIALTSTDIYKLMNQTDGVIQQLAIENQLKAYFKDSEKYNQFNEVLSCWYDRTGSEVEQIKKIAATGSLGQTLIRYNIANINERRDQSTVPPLDLHYLNIAFNIGTNAVNLVTIINNMRSAAQMQISVENRESDVNTLNQYNKETNEKLKNWLKIGGLLESLGLKKTTIPPYTLAFFTTIGQLCQLGQEGADFLTPQIAWSALGSTTYESFV